MRAAVSGRTPARRAAGAGRRNCESAAKPYLSSNGLSGARPNPWRKHEEPVRGISVRR